MFPQLSKPSVRTKRRGKMVDSPKVRLSIHVLAPSPTQSLRNLQTQNHNPKFKVDQVLGPNGTPFLIQRTCALSAKLVNLLFPRLDQHPPSSKNCRRKKIDIKRELNTLCL